MKYYTPKKYAFSKHFPRALSEDKKNSPMKKKEAFRGTNFWSVAHEFPSTTIKRTSRKFLRPWYLWGKGGRAKIKCLKIFLFYFALPSRFFFSMSLVCWGSWTPSSGSHLWLFNGSLLILHLSYFSEVIAHHRSSLVCTKSIDQFWRGLGGKLLTALQSEKVIFELLRHRTEML